MNRREMIKKCEDAYSEMDEFTAHELESAFLPKDVKKIDVAISEAMARIDQVSQLMQYGDTGI